MRNEWEKRIQSYRTLLSKEPAWYLTAAELYKEELKKASDRETTAGNEVRLGVSAFVLAPVLCGYVRWVLSEALKTGKKRLYFLARDGWQMYRIAEVFCKEWKLPIECRYLYCSRYALRTAEYGIRGEEALSYLCLDGIFVTLKTVFRRAGIFDNAEQEKFAKLLGRAGDEDRQLSSPELKKLRGELAACPRFMEYLLQNSEERYSTTIEYLRQEGMLEDVPYALVDSGWTGSIQKSFACLLRHAGYQRALEGYYFGLYECPEGMERNSYHSYYFAPEVGLLCKARFNNNLLECVCSSPEGMTEGYEFAEYTVARTTRQGMTLIEGSGEGRYVPRLAKKVNPNRERVEAHTAYFVRYAKLLAARFQTEELAGVSGEEERPSAASQILQTSEQLLSLFMARPTKEEAEEYGSYVFCDDVIGEENQQLAVRLNKNELRQNRLTRQLAGRFLKAKCRAPGSAW